MKLLKEEYHSFQLSADDTQYVMELIADNLNQFLKDLSDNISINMKQEVLILTGLPDVTDDPKKEEKIRSFIDSILLSTVDHNKVDYLMEFYRGGKILIVFSFSPINIVDYYFK